MGRLSKPLLIIIFVCGALSQTYAQNNLVINGNFQTEAPFPWSPWGWTVNIGVALGFYTPYGPNYATVAGTMFESLSTQPGQAYDLQYATLGTGDVQWGSVDLGTVTTHVWTLENVVITATSSNTVLNFVNPLNSYSGVFDVTDISVTAAPEPTSLGMLCGVLLVICLWKRVRLSAT